MSKKKLRLGEITWAPVKIDVIGQDYCPESNIWFITGSSGINVAALDNRSGVRVEILSPIITTESYFLNCRP